MLRGQNQIPSCCLAVMLSPPKLWVAKLWVAGDAQVVKFFFKHGHVAYQIKEDDKQNRIQENFHPRVKLVTLG